MTTLETKLGLAFTNQHLLQQALTHKSFHNESPGESTGHNERLEFLGDAVLSLAVSDMLMARFPEMTEGDLSKLRASLVNEAILAELAESLQISEFMRLGRGEILTGGGRKPRLLAATFEAILGALYSDGQFTVAVQFVQKLFAEKVGEVPTLAHFDFKTQLQEKMQNRWKKVPNYILVSEEGPDHAKTFVVEVCLGDRVLARAQGKSKKQAEQQAAKNALEQLG